MPESKVFDMPMELGLELVTIIRAHLANVGWELFDDVVNEVDHCPTGHRECNVPRWGVCLRVFIIDLEGANSRRVVDRRVLEKADLFAALPSEGQELNIHLNMMTRNLFLVTLGLQFAHTGASGQSIETVAYENAVGSSIRDLDAAIAL